MAQTIEVNKEELISVVNLLEEDGPLKSINELYTSVAASLNVSLAIVKNRIEGWRVPTKTKRPLRKSYDIPESAENTIVRQRLVYTPACRCPVELQSSEEDDVISWAQEIRLQGAKIGQIYLFEAITYFAREFFDANSQDFIKIKLIIKQMFLEEKSLEQSSEHIE